MERSGNFIVDQGKIEQIDIESMKLCFLLEIKYSNLIGQ
jgi:hypothetical protein